MATAVRERPADHAHAAEEPIVELVPGKEHLYRAELPAIGVTARSHSPRRASVYVQSKALWLHLRALLRALVRTPALLPESRAVGMRRMDLTPEAAAEIHDRMRNPKALPRRAPRDLPLADSSALR